MVAILGGSTPFTAALVEALRARDLPRCELRLFGQDRDALERIRRYGQRRLLEAGWTVSCTPRLDEAVDGATAVVNQIRFGGLAGRAADEDLASRFRLPADETLGPCGLSAALRVVPQIRTLAAELGRRCPDAWVLNLANPLSLTTAAMVEAGAPKKCFGLCELPFATVLETCRILDRPLRQVNWRYVGLNHRGFVSSFAVDGEELLPVLPDLLGSADVFGITSDDIRDTGALPLKYFRLSKPNAAARPAPSRRAEFLQGLKNAIAREMDEGQGPPKSLALRDLRWYREVVVPMLSALFSEDARSLVLNLRTSDGLVREVPAQVSRRGVEPREVEPPERVRPWIDRWTAHERALMRAVRTPSQVHLEEALELDPMVPKTQVREIARAISTDYVN